MTVIRHRLVAVLICAVAALGLSACSPGGEPPGPSDSRALLNDSFKEDGERETYMAAMAKVEAAMGKADFASAARNGKQQQLKSYDRNWDKATQLAAAIDPPADVAEQHAQLVKSMKALGKWNQRMVDAAPNKARTSRLYSQAMKSPASEQLGGAISGILGAGYPIMQGPPGTAPEY
jgi:hypothetical protein